MINHFSTAETAVVYDHLANSIIMYEKVAKELKSKPADAPERVKHMYEDYLALTVIDGNGLASNLLQSAMRNVRWRELCNHLKEETSNA